MNDFDEIMLSVVSNVNLDYILDEYQEMDWFDAGVAKSRYKNDNKIKAKDIRDANVSTITVFLQETLDKEVKPLVKNYAKEHNILDLVDEQYHVVKYTKGQFFAEHTDSTEEYPRRVSVLFYLNDDYSGGTITFTKLNKSIKPDKGSVIIFPSNDKFCHSADPVEDGTKYVVVGFWS
jgi:Rps23 Pro-64 3,4-dihydroxylase Tpa1-like proline 4-hydroxylase